MGPRRYFEGDPHKLEFPEASRTEQRVSPQGFRAMMDQGPGVFSRWCHPLRAGTRIIYGERKSVKSPVLRRLASKKLHCRRATAWTSLMHSSILWYLSYFRKKFRFTRDRLRFSEYSGNLWSFPLRPSWNRGQEMLPRVWAFLIHHLFLARRPNRAHSWEKHLGFSFLPCELQVEWALQGRTWHPQAIDMARTDHR